MIETINGKAYVKKGDKVYEVGGGGANIIFANSVEELPDPSTVPENTVGLVPSEGTGGLPVVELETTATSEGTTLSESEGAMIEHVGIESFLLKIPVYYNSTQVNIVTPMTCIDMSAAIEGVFIYSGTLYIGSGALVFVVIANVTGSWHVQLEGHYLSNGE